MPQTVIAGNWKMNTTLAEAVALAQGVRKGLTGAGGAHLVLCPPFISLAAVQDAVRGSAIQTGAQNMHFEKSGAFTGEVSAAMLQGLCQYVILGHSERRQLFGETDTLINKKVQAAFQNDLKPILCVGETLEQREAGRAAALVAEQVRQGLNGVSNITGLVVAYEPVWAIGTGKAATPEIAAEIMDGAIGKTLQSMFGTASGQVPLLYGGSVNPGNAAGFAAQKCIHGALVGGASLRADQVLDIARLMAQAKGAG
ncbi:MAG: triose-phosphate isomerase [SAR202 cluster bacterium]|nr:triose-phosphate isomerase [SAR202 cluster bacterium]